jgi:hypothetical protein
VQSSPDWTLPSQQTSSANGSYSMSDIWGGFFAFQHSTENTWDPQVQTEATPIFMYLKISMHANRQRALYPAFSGKTGVYRRANRWVLGKR